MKNNLLLLVIILYNFVFSQEMHHENFINVEGNYRSYGRPDNIGHGIALEYSRDTQYNWLGFGVNLSYFGDQYKEYTVYNPYDPSEVYHGIDKMRHFKTSIFAQLYIINRDRFVDLYFNVGFHVSKYNQNYYLLYWSTNEYNQTFDFSREDVGKKNWELGYEVGINVRLNMNKFFVTPNIDFLSSKKEGIISTINLKLGYNF